jgi:hypothetical protein
MKFYSHYIIAFFCIISAYNSYAQIPGYQGKTSSIGLTIDYTLNMGDVNSFGIRSKLGIFDSERYQYYYDPFTGGGSLERYDYSNIKHTLFSSSITYSLSYEKLVSRSAAILINTFYKKTGVIFDDYLEYQNDQFGNQIPVYYKGFISDVNAFGAKFGYKVFQNNLAPMGKYIAYYLGLTSSSALIPSEIFPKTTTKRKGVVVPHLSFAYGRQRVFFDKIIYDRAISFDVLNFIQHSLSVLNAGGENSVENSAIGSEVYYKNILKKRMIVRDMFTIYFSCRYLF